MKFASLYLVCSRKKQASETPLFGFIIARCQPKEKKETNPFPGGLLYLSAKDDIMKHISSQRQTGEK
jgi:hypothetical protein